MTAREPLTLPPYTPTDWELRLPGYPIIGNRWRSSSFPEALGSLPSEAEWRLTYENRTSDEALALLLPWRATGGGQWPLTQLPPEVAYGVDDVEFLKRLTGTIWTIAREPQKQSVKKGRFNVTIELVYELTLEVNFVSVFQSDEATGFALSIATSIAAGSAQGGTTNAATGFALSVATSFAAGAAAGNAFTGLALNIVMSFVGGVAQGGENNAAAGFALSVTMSFVGGVAKDGLDGEAAGFALSVAMSFVGGATEGVSIGEAYEGGFFAGYISHTADGVPTHALIVAPRATGASGTGYTLTTNYAVKTSNTATSGTLSLFDGAANTAAMVTAGIADHPAAQFCVGLNIGGLTDWYLPSTYELDIAYENLKPTATDNNTLFGINPYAVPARAANRSALNPTTTSIALFASGGAQAFLDSLHWSSSTGTFNVNVAAFAEAFDNGSRQEYSKTTSNIRTRAFRKVAL